MTALQGKKRKKLRLSMTGRRAVNGYLFILPWLIGFICFYVNAIISRYCIKFNTDN